MQGAANSRTVKHKNKRWKIKTIRKHSDLAQDYKNGDYDRITYEMQKGKLLQSPMIDNMTVFTRPNRRGQGFGIFFTSFETYFQNYSFS